MWRWPVEWQERRIGFFASDDAIAICELEALSLLVAVRDLSPFIGPGRRCVVHIDNLPLVQMVSKLTTPSPACLEIIKELMWWLVIFGITVVPVHIRSEHNEVADALSRAHELSVEELHQTLRRWVRSHPDATAWTAQPPLRPDLLPFMHRCDYEAPGRPYLGLLPICDARRAFV
jgi:hypothetical protein